MGLTDFDENKNEKLALCVARIIDLVQLVAMISSLAYEKNGVPGILCTR
jgi:hypothetical protein